MLADWFAESLKGGSWVMGDVTADVINNENKSGKEQWVEWRALRGCSRTKNAKYYLIIFEYGKEWISG